MSLMQKKVVLIAAGLVVLLATFFLVFQNNQDTVTELESESRNLQNQVNLFNTLQSQVNIMSKTAPEQQSAIDEFVAGFPCKVPQQKILYNLYLLMKNSGIRITSISPGDPQTFLQDGQLVTAENMNAAAVSGSAVEQDPETRVAVTKMVGKDSVYEIQLAGSLNQIMKALDWVAGNKEYMAVTNISLSYDSSTGKLTGGMAINFFELNGNGKAYEEPDISDISIASGNIYKLFGTSKK